MAKSTVPVNFKDDIMNSAMGGKRRYRMINNSDGTISLEDVTTYDQVGSNFGAAQINATNQAVNAAADAGKIIDDLDAINNVTKEGYMAGALALKQVNSNLGEDENGMTVHEKLNTLLNRVGYNVTATYKETLLAMNENNLNYTVPEDGNYLFILSDKVGKADTSLWFIKHNGVLIQDGISRSLQIHTNSDYAIKSSICTLQCKSGDIISSNTCTPYSLLNVFQLT